MVISYQAVQEIGRWKKGAYEVHLFTILSLGGLPPRRPSESQELHRAIQHHTFTSLRQCSGRSAAPYFGERRAEASGRYLNGATGHIGHRAMIH